MKTIYFDTSQPIFNMKFKNELSKLLTWAKSELVKFFPLLTPFCRFSMKTIYFDTRIKATRCETLRTVTTNNSKNTHIWHTEILKWALQTGHLSQKWAATIFSTSEPILLTRIKATISETLRTVTTNNSKNSHIWHTEIL